MTCPPNVSVTISSALCPAGLTYETPCARVKPSFEQLLGAIYLPLQPVTANRVEPSNPRCLNTAPGLPEGKHKVTPVSLLELAFNQVASLLCGGKPLIRFGD